MLVIHLHRQISGFMLSIRLLTVVLNTYDIYRSCNILPAGPFMIETSNASRPDGIGFVNLLVVCIANVSPFTSIHHSVFRPGCKGRRKKATWRKRRAVGYIRLYSVPYPTSRLVRNEHCSQPLDSETPHPLSAWSTLVSLYFTCSLCFVSGPLDPSSPTIIVAPNPALRVESAGNGSECSAGAMENCSEPTIVKILAIPLLKVARPLIRRKQSQGGRGTTQTQEPNT
jgi:hypothetical protein